jgi:hypothetical protein
MDRLFENFRTFLHEDELEEADRASKEGIKLPGVLDRLKGYVSDDDTPKYFMQFSNIIKLGINPRYGFKETPQGIYSYPLTTDILKQLTIGKIPYAQNRKYIIIFSVRPEAVVYTVSWKTKDTIPKEEYIEMAIALYSAPAAKLTGNTKYHEELLGQQRSDPEGTSGTFSLIEKTKSYRNVIQRAKHQNELGWIWELTKGLSNNAVMWRSVLYNILDIDGVVDTLGSGVIHPAEPVQAVFFSKSAIKIEEMLPNTETPIKQGKRNTYKFSRLIADGFLSVFGRKPDNVENYNVKHNVEKTLSLYLNMELNTSGPIRPLDRNLHKNDILGWALGQNSLPAGLFIATGFDEARARELVYSRLAASYIESMIGYQIRRYRGQIADIRFGNKRISKNSAVLIDEIQGLWESALGWSRTIGQEAAGNPIDVLAARQIYENFVLKLKETLLKIRDQEKLANRTRT